MTHVVQRLEGDVHRVATSRRHRKGLPPHEVRSLAAASDAVATHAHAFSHLLLPRRLGWWIALLFFVGSLLFMLGGLAATWPDLAPAPLRDPVTLGSVFFIGSVFFTSAAWLQWLEALNSDVVTAMGSPARHWRWFGWCPRNLGYLACSVQLVGTLLFNFNTADALIPGLSWQEENHVIWVPDMLGSICFLVASYLAYAEISHGAFSFSPRSVSWWIAIVNLAGSVAFQLSALTSRAGPSPHPDEMFWSSLLTAIGALGFLIGSYLLVPELFDTGEAA